MKEKKNRQNFEHNPPRPTQDLLLDPPLELSAVCPRSYYNMCLESTIVLATYNDVVRDFRLNKLNQILLMRVLLWSLICVKKKDFDFVCGIQFQFEYLTCF